MSFRRIVRDVRESFSRRSSKVRSKSHGALLETHHQDPVVTKNSRWANLPPEILRDVVKKLEESKSTWPARKDVVACAAVCKSWRKMCKDTVKSPEFSSKLTFPVSLKQPGPRDGTIKSFIKRDKSNFTYHLYLSLRPSLLVEDGKFLLSAKRTRRATYTEFVISMDADCVSRSSSTYIGKMRSNFLGSKFIIYDAAPAYNSCQKLSQPNRSRRFNSKKVSPKVPSGNYEIAQVTYEVNVLGRRRPRRMHCIMHSIPALALDPGDTFPGQPELLERSFDGSSKIIDNSGEFSSARFSDIVGPQGEDENQVKERPLLLRNKTPRWHEKLECWCLNFRGRVTIASVKNFQLMTAAAVQAGAATLKPDAATVQPPSGGALTKATSSQQPGQSDHDKIILQFGRVGKDMFVNYNYMNPKIFKQLNNHIIDYEEIYWSYLLLLSRKMKSL